MMRSMYVFWNRFFTFILPAVGVGNFLWALFWTHEYQTLGWLLVIVFIGNVLVYIARRNGAGTVGTITVDTVHPDKDVFTLDMGEKPLLNLSGKKEVSFKVVNSQ